MNPQLMHYMFSERVELFIQIIKAILPIDKLTFYYYVVVVVAANTVAVYKI